MDEFKERPNSKNKYIVMAFIGGIVIGYLLVFVFNVGIIIFDMLMTKWWYGVAGFIIIIILIRWKRKRKRRKEREG